MSQIRTAIKRKLVDQHLASMDGRLAERGVAPKPPKRQYPSAQTSSDARMSLAGNIRQSAQDERQINDFVTANNNTALVSAARLHTSGKQNIAFDPATGVPSYTRPLHRMTEILEGDATVRREHLRDNSSRKQLGRIRAPMNDRQLHTIPLQGNIHNKNQSRDHVDTAALREDAEATAKVSFVATQRGIAGPTRIDKTERADHFRPTPYNAKSSIVHPVSLRQHHPLDTGKDQLLYSRRAGTTGANNIASTVNNRLDTRHGPSRDSHTSYATRESVLHPPVVHDSLIERRIVEPHAVAVQTSPRTLTQRQPLVVTNHKGASKQHNRHNVIAQQHFHLPKLADGASNLYDNAPFVTRSVHTNPRAANIRRDETTTSAGRIAKSSTGAELSYSNNPKRDQTEGATMINGTYLNTASATRFDEGVLASSQRMRMPITEQQQRFRPEAFVNESTLAGMGEKRTSIHTEAVKHGSQGPTQSIQKSVMQSRQTSPLKQTHIRHSENMADTTTYIIQHSGDQQSRQAPTSIMPSIRSSTAPTLTTERMPTINRANASVTPGQRENTTDNTGSYVVTHDPVYPTINNRASGITDPHTEALRGKHSSVAMSVPITPKANYQGSTTDQGMTQNNQSSAALDNNVNRDNTIDRRGLPSRGPVIQGGGSSTAGQSSNSGQDINRQGSMLQQPRTQRYELSVPSDENPANGKVTTDRRDPVSQGPGRRGTDSSALSFVTPVEETDANRQNVVSQGSKTRHTDTPTAQPTSNWTVQSDYPGTAVPSPVIPNTNPSIAESNQLSGYVSKPDPRIPQERRVRITEQSVASIRTKTGEAARQDQSPHKRNTNAYSVSNEARTVSQREIQPTKGHVVCTPMTQAAHGMTDHSLHSQKASTDQLPQNSMIANRSSIHTDEHIRSVNRSAQTRDGVKAGKIATAPIVSIPGEPISHTNGYPAVQTRMQDADRSALVSSVNDYHTSTTERCETTNVGIVERNKTDEWHRDDGNVAPRLVRHDT